MGRVHKLLASVLVSVGISGVAHAAPTIDSINVQGYMKKANGTAVTDGAYNLAFGVFQNGVNLWSRSYSVQITNGLFSRTLSGLGTDLSALPGGTGMNADFSATTFGAALLLAGGATGVTVRVYAMDMIDGTNPQFDLTLAAVPTAMVCEAAKGVVDGSVTVDSLAAAAYVVTSAGAADDGKLVVLDATGKLDASVLPDTIGNSGANGVTTVEGGTGAGGQTIISSGGTGSSAVVVDAGTAGGSVEVTANTTGNITLTQGTTSGQLTLGSATSTGGSTLQGAGPTVVTSSQAAAGAVTVSTTGGGVATTLITSNGTSASAVHLTATGVGGGVTIAPELTGDFTAGGGATSGAVTIGNVSTGASVFGNTGAGSATTVRSGTGGLTVAVTGTTGNVSITPGTTSGTVAIGNGSTGSAAFGNNGAGSVTMLNGETVTVGGTGTTALNLGTTATGDLVTTVGSTAGASETVIQAGSGKIKVGSTGGAITAMGHCSFTQALTTAGGNIACVSVPASTAVVVSCSPTATTNVGAGVIFRSTGAGDQIHHRSSAAVNSFTWNCVWIQL